MITLSIILIITLPILYFTYKWVYKSWQKISIEEKYEKEKDKMLEEINHEIDEELKQKI